MYVVIYHFGGELFQYAGRHYGDDGQLNGAVFPNHVAERQSMFTSHRLISALVEFAQHGYLAVDLFFVLSGFVMALTYRQLFNSGFTLRAYRTFLGRRIARIYPLYLAATAVGFAFLSAGLISHASVDRILNHAMVFPPAIALTLNLLMIQTWGLTGSFDGAAWSISTEWAAYLLFPLLLLLATSRRSGWGWAAAFTSVVTIAVLPAFSAQNHDSRFHDLRFPLDIYDCQYALPVLRCVAEFLLGLLAFRVADSPQGKRFGANTSVALVLCAVLVIIVSLPLSDFFVVMLFPALIISLTSENNIPAKLLASPLVLVLGKLSYSIYLTHMLVHVAYVRVLVPHLLPATMKHADLLGIIICTALTLVLAALTYWTIESPGRRWLRNILESRAIDKASLRELGPTA